MSKGLSKSKYTNFRKCPKCLWLGVYKPEEQVIDASTEARFTAGNEVGDLAMGLFGPFTEVSAYTPDGRLDVKAMLSHTQDCLDNEVENICEASFSFDGCFCAVDILHKQDGGYAIYEVKSSTSADKEVYAQDVAFQKWVLTKCGVNVTGSYLVCINNEYVRHGDIDIHQLFSINDISEGVDAEYPQIANNCKLAKEVLNSSKEPSIAVGSQCQDPYECAFKNYCMRQEGFTETGPSVFDLYRLNYEKKLEYWRDGIITFPEIAKSDIKLSNIQEIQVSCTLENTNHIDKKGIRNFLDSLSYPIYHLDFETMMPVIPPFDGVRPYQQTPFQYSLHIEHKDGTLEHKEFLGDSVHDPRRALAEQLCHDIPKNVCSMAYNKGFECGRLNELAEYFPDLADHLLNISDHVVDLLEPFRAGYCYYPAMGGSFSIKSVLPALFPDDPKLDYHNLPGCVHNGGEAMDIYPQIAKMSSQEQEETRESLLRYCELDTFAMVKLLSKLRELAR
ncbi:MAG: DUF2779 domain-containing protein [Bacteroidales bacterium]|nr:DUF2779 domain-containing protein [Bacteroidales bacterium]